MASALDRCLRHLPDDVRAGDESVASLEFQGCFSRNQQMASWQRLLRSIIVFFLSSACFALSPELQDIK